MTDTRSDSEKEASAYFDHWKYVGSPIQRWLRIGPRKAFYRDGAAVGETQEIEIPLTVVGLSEPPGTRQKGVTLQQWMLDFADQAGREETGAAALLKKSPWAYACVDVRARALAAIPWGIFRDTEEQVNHDMAVRLREVNPELNWLDLIAQTESDMCVFGKAYWRKIRAGRNVKWLMRLNPATITPNATAAGIASFRQQLPSGETKDYKRGDVVYFHLYDPLNDLGSIAPLGVCQKAIEIEVEADKHLKEFFENHAMPDYVISLETTNPNELKRLSDQWKKDFAGEGKQHKVGWIGGKGKPESIGYAPEELALEIVRAECRREICGTLGVPPALVGAWEAANYATIREQRQALYTEKIIPEAEYIAAVINAELAPEFDAAIEFRWKFDKLAVIQEDISNRSKRYAWEVQAGIISPDAAAARLGYRPDEVPDEPPAPRNNNFGAEGSSPNFGGEGPQAGVREGRQKDLGTWRRKAIKRLKDGKELDFEFKSGFIPGELAASIVDGLAYAKTPEEVGAVFESAMNSGFDPGYPIGDGLDRDTIRAFVDIVKAFSQKSPVTVNMPPSEVHVTNEMQPTPVTVENKVEPTALTIQNVVSPTPVNIENKIEAKANPTPLEVIVPEQKPPKLARRHDKQSVSRDKKDNVTGSQTEIQYEYEE